jgi:parallel beta-helix repeat protein
MVRKSTFSIRGSIVGDTLPSNAIKIAAKEAVRDSLKFGKFYKKGSKQGIKEWRKRLFVLTSDCKLFYYKSIKDKSQTGILDITNTIITRCDSELEKKNAFKITNFMDDPERIFYAHCENEQDVSAWLIVLTNASGTCLTVSQNPTEEQLKTKRVYTTIQEAINAAQGGEKIRVHEGVYREQLIIDKIIVLEGVVSEQVIARQRELKQEYEKELRRSEERNVAKVNREKEMVLNLDPEHLRQQQELLEKQKEMIEEKIRGMSLRERKSSTNVPPSPRTPRRSRSTVASVPVITSVVPLFTTHGNISNVIIEGPPGESPIIYRSSGGSISNITFKMDTTSTDVEFKKLNDLVTATSDQDDPMVSCIEVENGELTMTNCTVKCYSGSGILCMNRSVVQLVSCDISEVRDMGVWVWDRSSVTATECKVSVAGTNGIHTSGHSRMKLERCMISSCGLFGILVTDSSECIVQTCEIKQVGADAIRVQNAAKCFIRISELKESTEYGLGVYSNMDGCAVSITEDCKFSNNKMGDYLNKQFVKTDKI